MFTLLGPVLRMRRTAVSATSLRRRTAACPARAMGERNRWARVLVCAGLGACVSGAGFAQTIGFPSDDLVEFESDVSAIAPAGPAAPAGTPGQIVQTYIARSLAARRDGDSERELAELQAGLKAVGAQSRASYQLHRLLEQHYSDRGRSTHALKSAEAALNTAPNRAATLSEHARLASKLSEFHQRDQAMRHLKRAQAILIQLRSSRSWDARGYLWQALVARATGKFHYAAGHLDEAEAAFRSCAGFIQAHMRDPIRVRVGDWGWVVRCNSQLVNTLLRQGKLEEARALGIEARKIAETFATTQDRPLYLSSMVTAFARLLIELGRLGDAKTLLQQSISEQFAGGARDSSSTVKTMRKLLAVIAMIEGDWTEANRIYESRAQGAGADLTGEAGEFWGYTLLRLGQVDRALDLLSQLRRIFEERYDKDSYYLWEARAFHALALAAAGQREAALRELSVAVPRVVELGHGERSSSDAGVMRTARLNWILDGYITLLAEFARAGERPRGMDPAAEAFRYADYARGSRVQRALAAAASRARLDDPALAELVRREQDLQREMSVLSDALVDLLARGRIAEEDGIAAAMRAELQKLRMQHEAARAELARRFPNFADLLEPKPLAVAEVQKLLRPGEALIASYVGQDRTLVWAVAPGGRLAFAVAPLGSAGIEQRIAHLRRALDPADATLAQVPAYDFTTAHELYAALLAPVEAAWKGARTLIIVPHGALGRLPFAALLTAPYAPATGTLRFAEYADAPWLIRQVAVTQLPSTSSLSLVRGAGVPARGERDFVGFGDPQFSSEPSAARKAPESERRTLFVSGVARKHEDDQAVSPLSQLAALPDTAEEIREIAAILRADAERDVFLRVRATESNVKRQQLQHYRVVMFATHGLMPNDLPGLYQPALALSNPALTGEREDGMLMMDEILALKLRADWVVLSACNTASAGGAASEAVSGLGRSFFYAGAKALLVTNWPVETVSAKWLTTELFRRQAADPKLSRAQALQQAELAVMQRVAYAPGDGFSYAHPLFWAPFTLVGDGG